MDEIEQMKMRGLSKSEARVVEKVIMGYGNKEVAWQLHLSEACVKWHLTNVYKKTNTRDRLELTKRMQKWGIRGKKP